MVARSDNPRLRQQGHRNPGWVTPKKLSQKRISYISNVIRKEPG